MNGLEARVYSSTSETAHSSGICLSKKNTTKKFQGQREKHYEQGAIDQENITLRFLFALFALQCRDEHLCAVHFPVWHVLKHARPQTFCE